LRRAFSPHSLRFKKPGPLGRAVMPPRPWRWMAGMPWRWMAGPASYAAYKLGRAVVPPVLPPEAGLETCFWWKRASILNPSLL
jgi:hypothetical protein